MSLSPLEREAVEDLADCLHAYLPGQAVWSARETFASVANEVRLGGYWPGGRPKGEALQQLLASTLDHQRGRFAILVDAIVRTSLEHRKRSGVQLSRSDVVELKSVIDRLGIGVPIIEDPRFLHGLPDTAADPEARAERERAVRQELTEQYLRLQSEGPGSRTESAESVMERLLNRMLRLSGLERIDRFTAANGAVTGSFRLDQHRFYLRAEWSTPIPATGIDAFVAEQRSSGQLLGLLLSVNGFSAEAVEQTNAQPAPAFLLMDGAHLFRVFHGDITLDALLRDLVRRLAIDREPYVPIGDLLGR